MTNNEIPDKLIELRFDNPIIHYALSAYERNIFTKEQFYTEIIYALSEQNNIMKKELLDFYTKAPFIINLK